MNDPKKLEATMSGLIIMSSAYGSVRAEDGLCQLHDRYVRASFGCGDFAATVAVVAEEGLEPPTQGL
jgi:hypothetical protein